MVFLLACQDRNDKPGTATANLGLTYTIDLTIAHYNSRNLSHPYLYTRIHQTPVVPLSPTRGYS